MKKILLGLVIIFCSCSISHSDRYQYWDELSDQSKSEIIKSLNVDKNVIMLYLHETTLSDDDASKVILDTLCASTEGDKRMLYFHVLNEVVKYADGCLAEMLWEYCLKYVTTNTDYTLEYFSEHRDISDEYSTSIAMALYYDNVSINDFKQQLSHSAKSPSAKNYLPQFLNDIEDILHSEFEDD